MFLIKCSPLEKLRGQNKSNYVYLSSPSRTDYKLSFTPFFWGPFIATVHYRGKKQSPTLKPFDGTLVPVSPVLQRVVVFIKPLRAHCRCCFTYSLLQSSAATAVSLNPLCPCPVSLVVGLTQCRVPREDLASPMPSARKQRITGLTAGRVGCGNPPRS